MNESLCFHCHLPIAPGIRHHAVINAERQSFCCPGCKAVAETIVASGLSRYYVQRTSVATPPESLQTAVDFSLFDEPAFQAQFTKHDHASTEITLYIEGITCSACVWLLEKRLALLAGVMSVEVNLSRRLMRVRWNPDTLKLSDILRTIHTIGYQPCPWTPDSEEERLRQENRTALQRLGIAGIGMMQVGMYAIALNAGALQGISDTMRDLLRLSSLLLATLVVFYSAKPFFENGWRSIKNRQIGMDLPVALAIGLAYAASCWATFTGSGEVYFDSVTMFTFFLLASRYIEMRARYRLNRQGNTIPVPDLAWKLEADVVHAVAPHSLQVNDLFLVKPGERIPVDGRIVEGESDVDESVMTGEFLPRVCRSGDPVLAGSLNGEALLKVQAIATLGSSRITEMSTLLQMAQMKKLPISQMADRLAGFFIARVLFLTLLVFAIWLYVDPSRAFWIALSVLVVSCPCALSLATPTALTAALGSLKSQGILVKNSVVLETLPSITHLIFDKTGTLTTGRMTLHRAVHLVGHEADNQAIADQLESFSNHPIAKAFSPWKQEHKAKAVRVVSGQGVEGELDGIVYRIGSAAFTQQSMPSEAIQPSETSLIPVYLADAEGTLHAIFYVSDKVRLHARNTVQHFEAAGVQVAMLTGDTSHAADQIAHECEIHRWKKGMTPEEKLEYLEQTRADKSRTMAVGDGINDLLLLGAADISVAVNSSTELTKSTCDIILVTENLDRLSLLYDISKKLRRVIRQNLGWALFYNLSAVPLAAFGLVPPWVAALGMSASSLVVVANASRLAHKQKAI